MNLKPWLPCNFKISTAKSGESIISTGIGDIRLNTWSEDSKQGQQISIVIQQGYLVSQNRRNRLSVSYLSKQKFQTVLPSETQKFAAGISDCRHGNRSEQNHISIESVDRLYFVKTNSNSYYPIHG